MTNTNLSEYRRWASEPLTERPIYSVVVPAFNEEWRIIPTVGAIATHMSGLGQPWELIVADDGSTDATVELVKDLQLPNLELLIADENGGKGSAVRRGMLHAAGDVILFADADQSTPIEQFADLLAKVDLGYDVVVGSRAGAAEVENKSTLRKLFSFGLQTIVRGLFHIPVVDTQCGFKLFTSDAAQRLFSHQVIDGFSFDLEILFLAEKFGMRTAEVPVRWIDAPGSKVETAKVAKRFLQDLLVIRSNNGNGTYNAPNHAVPPARWPEATQSPTAVSSDDRAA